MKPLTARDERQLAEFDPDDAFVAWAETLARKAIPGETLVEWRAPRAPKFIHPSSLYKKCDAYLAYELMGIPNTSRTRGKTQLTYDVGTAIHACFQFYQHTRADYFGYSYASEVKFVDESKRMAGRADGVSEGWPIKSRLVWEFKTIRSQDFARLRAPQEGHLLQAHAYMAMLDIPAAIIMYLNKDKPVTISFKVPFDKNKWESIEQRVKRIVKQVERKKFVKTEGYDCRECRFASYCEPTSRGNSVLYAAGLALPRSRNG